MNNKENLFESANHQELHRSAQTIYTSTTQKLYDDLLTRIVNNLKAMRASLILGGIDDFKIAAESYQQKKPAIPRPLHQPVDSQVASPLPLSAIRETYKTKQLTHYDMSVPARAKELGFYMPLTPDSQIFCQPIYADHSISGVLYLELNNPHDANKQDFASWLSLWAEQASHTLESATQLKLLEEQNRTKTQALVRARKKDNSVNYKRMQILSEMNSEIRTPLNTIVGYSQLLQKKGDRLNLPQSFNKYIENICSSSYRLGDLLENILDYAGFDTGKKSIRKEEIDLRLFIRSVYHSVKTDAEQKAVKISYQYEDDLPDHFLSDRSALYQAIQILFRHAIRRSKPGRSLTLSSDLEESHLLFRVQATNAPNTSESDSSCYNGQSENHAPNSSIETQGNPVFNLAIARKIVSILKGELEETDEENGNCFYTVKIPFHRSHIKFEESRLPGKSPIFHDNEKALVLSKDPYLQETLKSMLNDLGVTPVFIDQTEESLNQITPQQADLIIADFCSPEDAKTLTQTIKRTALPVIGITKEIPKDPLEKGKSCNIQEIIQLPLNFNKLISPLKNLLKKSGFLPQLAKKETTNILSNSTGPSLRIPENLENELLADLDKLRAIPIYKGNTLITKLRTMMIKCRKYQSHLTPIFKKMELALFDGNNDLLNELILEAQTKTQNRNLHQFS